MAQVTMYASAMCGFCHRAKKLLKQKGVDFDEIDVTMKPARKREMMEQTGGAHTVPQIFIDGRHIGGCDELYDLERRGELDPMLGAAA